MNPCKFRCCAGPAVDDIPFFLYEMGLVLRATPGVQRRRQGPRQRAPAISAQT